MYLPTTTSLLCTTDKYIDTGNFLH